MKIAELHLREFACYITLMMDNGGDGESVFPHLQRYICSWDDSNLYYLYEPRRNLGSN
jgi:hypothetical protein